MTRKEHELMLLMFTRLREAIGIIEEILTSRGIVGADDAKAFSQATHFDDAKLLKYLSQTKAIYEQLMADLEIVVEEEEP